ncbi:DUF6603 domain-containing protein [Streptomyces sp. NPDC057579]|uniref:DUF6603 domain-containing protein n=1 Tax=Streptomyces sp. NPDC057579 TaxID=3346172 RepID=UPI0036BEBFCB
MPLLVDDLLAYFPRGTETFDLPIELMDWPDGERVFDHLPGRRLKLTGAVGNPDTLTVSGVLSLPDADISAVVAFSAENSRVHGVSIELDLADAGDRLRTAAADIDLSSLGPVRARSGLLVAGPGGADVSGCPGTGAWIRFHVGQDGAVTFHAPVSAGRAGRALTAERMTLEHLLELAAEEGADDVPLPPCQLVDWLTNVEFYPGPAFDEWMFTATVEVPVAGLTTQVLVLRTASSPAENPRPVTVVMVDAVGGFDASGFPLVNFPSGYLSFSRFSVLYLSRELPKAQIVDVNWLIRYYGVGVQLPLPNPDSDSYAVEAGWTATLFYDLPNDPYRTLSVGWGGGRPSADPERSYQPLEVRAGPLEISYIYLALSGCELVAQVKATLTVGPLVFEVSGLGFALSLAGDWGARFTLSGLGVAHKTDAYKFVAAFMHTGDEFPSAALAGMVEFTLKNPEFSILAAGAWERNAEGWDSIFIYGEALLNKNDLFAVAGAQPFMVTGLAGGFGINSSVRLPSQEEMSAFPLIRRLNDAPALPTDPAPQPLPPAAALGELLSWVTAERGQYWVAGGLQFTVFNFLQCKALLLVEWGDPWKVALLGKVTLQLPKAATKPLAELNIDYAISVRRGQFAMDVALAPGSYLADPACKLTGGVAFYLWTERPRDFVISVGGFHPEFEPPRSDYPVPARVGYMWQAGSKTTMKGEIYAAVTNSAIMLGWNFACVFDTGGNFRIELWFTFHFDALIQWKPFYLEASLGVSFGVAATVKVLFVRIRISIEIGADVYLWTPPLGGKARIKLWFVSLTFDFKASRPGGQDISWNDFRMKLPAPVRVIPQEGVDINQADPAGLVRASNGGPLPVAADEFVVATDADIPACRITLNGCAPLINGVPLPDGERVDIRPMGLTGVFSEHKVEVWRNNVPYRPDQQGWIVEVIRSDMPTALWGKQLSESADALNEAPLPDRMVGLRFAVPEPQRDGTLGPISAASVDVEGLCEGQMPLRDPAPAGPPPTRDPCSIRKIAETLADPSTVARRAALHNALFDLGAAPGSHGPVDRYAETAGTAFTDPPMTTTAAR